MGAKGIPPNGLLEDLINKGDVERAKRELDSLADASDVFLKELVNSGRQTLNLARLMRQTMPLDLETQASMERADRLFHTLERSEPTTLRQARKLRDDIRAVLDEEAGE